ncbi:MAG: hypothetical protein V7707_08740 [Motiliproteus sp.]
MAVWAEGTSLNTGTPSQQLAEAESSPATPSPATLQANPGLAGNAPQLATPPSFLPLPLQDDWVKLSSGEWLKGEIQVLYEDDIEFDSDDLDMLVIDWEDVLELYSVQIISVRLVTGEELTGRISIQSGLLRFDNHPGQYSISSILSMAAGEPAELNFWTGEMSLSGSLSYGNIEELRLDFGLELRRHTSQLNIEYDGTLRESYGFDVEDSRRLFSTF